MWRDFGSLFYQENSTNLNENQHNNDQFIVKINNEPEDERSHKVLSILSCSYSLDNFDSHQADVGPNLKDNTKFKSNKLPDDKVIITDCKSPKRNLLNNSKILYKNQRITNAIKTGKTKKKETNKICKDYVIQNKDKKIGILQSPNITESLSSINGNTSSKGGFCKSIISSSSFYNKDSSHKDLKGNKIVNPLSIMK